MIENSNFYFFLFFFLGMVILSGCREPFVPMMELDPVSLFIFDKVEPYEVFTPALMSNYLINEPSKTSLEIEINRHGTKYKNQWYDDLSFKKFIGREIVAENASETIIVQEAIINNCADRWPVLPVSIDYSGKIFTKDKSEFLEIQKLSTVVYLQEMI